MRKIELSTLSVDDLVKRFAEITRDQDKAILVGQTASSIDCLLV